jgi:ribonuclease HII
LIGNQRCDRHDNAYGSNQHLARINKKMVDMLLYSRVYHHLRPLAIRTGKSWRRSEQTADQRTFCINLASLVAKVRATQIGKRRFMLLVAFDRQPCHLFGGCGYRAAAVMTTGFALERWNTRSEKADFLTVAGHWLCNPGKTLSPIFNPLACGL